MNRAAFLDRDGVINRKASDGGYVSRWEDFHVLPGVIEGIAELKLAGFAVIVVTNQRCVGTGLLTEEDLQRLHQQMKEHLAQAGASIDAIYYCPHEVEPPCRCRKPAPGMLLDAAYSHDLDLAASWMIGDSDVDIAAGRNAGCRTVRLVGSSPEEDQAVTFDISADVVARSLPEAIHRILRPAQFFAKAGKA